MTDLISSAVGGRVVSFNDEFFAEAVNLLRASDPVSNDEYTDRGKWMDGWETRRRREPGHDWCVIALGIPGRIREVTVDTSFFTGNYAEEFSLEACGAETDDLLADAGWVELIPRTRLIGDATASFPVGDPHRATYLRLNIYPDGGVARLRVEGEPIPDASRVCPDEGPADLVSSLVGGVALDASDTHYSQPSNLLRPSQPAGMWDGWETKRRRGPGHDWATFRLGLPGSVASFDVDTRHFKGNSPGWVSLHVSEDGETWEEVVRMAQVEADRVNSVGLDRPAHAGFLKLDLHPDGGVARLRAWGRPDPEPATSLRVDYLNSIFDNEARKSFRAACASERWVEAMTVLRPYRDGRAVLAAAGSSFDELDEEAWLEAFAGHPRIGERGDALANREQAGVTGASAGTLDELGAVNRAYEDRFGFTYIVYATGKSAGEMLDIARNRLGNTRDQELEVAAGQQRAITETRLRRMLCME